MRSPRFLSLVLTLVLGLITSAIIVGIVGDTADAQSGTIRYVAPTGTDSTDCTDPGNPCRTLQHAVDTASDEDVIKVAEGAYTDVQSRPAPPGYKNPPANGIISQVLFISKTVIIQGGYTAPGFADPPDPAANPTLLDAKQQGRVVYAIGNITPTIEGLILSGGSADGLGGGPWGWGDAGGGMYIITATATISNCQVLENAAGFGGGLYLEDSESMLAGSSIESNTAQWDGAGLFLTYSDSRVYSNTIASNVTVAYEGGGLYLEHSGARINGNLLKYNSAPIGGGAYMSHGCKEFVSNAVLSNTADYGGGLWLSGSNALVTENLFSHNQAVGGGGLGLSGCTSELTSNTFYMNTADIGGGLYLFNSDAMLSGNLILANTGDRGGGLFLDYSNQDLLINNVIVDNQANTAGSGVYVLCSFPHLIHTTVARNTGGDGSGIFVTRYLPDDAAAVLENTILVSHAVGIFVEDGQATLDGTLWHGNSTNWTGAVIHTNDHYGHPALIGPEPMRYHIGPSSAAIDAGVGIGISEDIDGQPRPAGSAVDIGADEYWCRICLPLVMRDAH